MNRNVIAVFGKSRSGKNTIGDMIAASRKGTVQIAFADKLKQICGELFGLTHEDMNTDEGKARATRLSCPTCPVCRSIDTEIVSSTIAFSSFYDQPVVNPKGPRQAACKACGAVGAPESFAGFWTPRTIMQFVATEGVRRVDPQAWARHAMKVAAMALGEGVEITASSDDRKVGGRFVPSLVVITDGRFRSELAAVREAGGAAWRVRRPDTDDRAVGLTGHASETEIDGIPDSDFDEVVMNVGSLDDLLHAVRGGLARPRQAA
jgi:hypothetical protein